MRYRLTRRAFLTALLFAPIKRIYHPVPIAKLPQTRWTHVETRGLITYVRKQQDGDWHITLEDAGAICVCEIIPSLPLPVPAKGIRIAAWGITRIDKVHGWAEIHPLEGYRELT